MIVRLEDFEKQQAFHEAINACELAEIVWTRDGKPVEVPRWKVEEFAETGLSNVSFPHVAGLVAE